MSVLQGLRNYYSLFGYKGVLLAAKARLLRKCTKVEVRTRVFNHPICLRLRSSDVTLFRSILLEGEYDWPFAKAPRVIVDAGANVGFTSIFFANKYPDAKIIAIEPEHSNYELLRRNTAAYGNVETIEAALWKENEHVRIVDPATGYWTFRVRKETEPDTSAKNHALVEGVTLDRVLFESRLGYVDILKIDIEGAEKEVFENSANWIDRVGVIVIEFHDRLKPGCSKAVRLAAKDFDLEWQRGEMTVLLRKDYAAASASESSESQELQVYRDQMRSALPLGITEIEPG